MTPLRRQATATILLLVLPTTASALATRMSSIRRIQSVRNEKFRKIARDPSSTTTRLSLMADPVDVAQQAHDLLNSHHDPASTLDFLSSLTLAKANALVPNQSLAPLSETIQSGRLESVVEVIPDLPAMPGGAPRSGNSFLAESFRDLYGGAFKSAAPENQPWGTFRGAPDGSLVVPARELDVVARYADLLNRIPLAAAVYALVDFFLINAEEDIAIAEMLFDEEEAVEAIMEVERRVILQRFVGLFLVVAATVAWSLLTYHPVPFNEL